MQQTTVIGGELGSNKVIISKLQRSRMQAVLSESSNIEIPAMVGFTKKERNFAEQCQVKLKRNYETSIIQIMNLFGDYDQQEHYFQNCKIQNIDGKFYFPEINLIKKNTKKQSNQNSMEIEGEQNNSNVVCKGLYIQQVLASYLNYLDTLIKKSSQNNLNMHYYSIFSVPSYFTPSQKKQVEQCFKIVDFPLMKVIDEHIANSTTFFQLKKKDMVAENQTKTVLFIDVGYSNTNVYITKFNQEMGQVFYVKCCKNLGIRTIDDIMYNVIAKKYNDKYGNFPFDNVKTKLRILDVVEKNRKILSSISDTNIDIECLVDEQDFSMSLTREEFEEYIKENFLQKLDFVLIETDKFIKKCDKISKKDIEIEILGGGVRIPAVKQLIQNRFNYVEKLGVSLSSESLSRGCAFYSAYMSSLINPLVKAENYYIQNCCIQEYVIKTIANGKIVREDKIQQYSPLPFNFQQVIDLIEFENYQKLDIKLQLFLGEKLQSESKLIINEKLQKINPITIKEQVLEEQSTNKMEIEENQQNKEKDLSENNTKIQEEQTQNKDQQNIQQQPKFIEKQITPYEEIDIQKQQERQHMFKIVYCLNEDQQLEIRQSQSIISYINTQGHLFEKTTPYYTQQHWENQLSEEEIQNFRNFENLQREVDLETQQIQELRNKFEKQLYEYQRQIGTDFKLKLQQADIDKLQTKLHEIQQWFEQHGLQTTELYILQEKYDSLITFFKPFEQCLQMDDLMTIEAKGSDALVALKGQTINGLKLNLRNQELGDGKGFFGLFNKGVFKIVQKLKDIQISQKLILDIGNCQITDEGAVELFKTCGNQFKNLKSLIIDIESNNESKLKNHLTIDCLTELNNLIISQQKSLEELKICMGYLYSEQFINLAQVVLSLPQLKSITIEIKNGDITNKERMDFNYKLMENKNIITFNFVYYNKNGIKETLW